MSYVDLLGTTYSASTIATGYGSYIAQPLLRRAVEGREDTLTEWEARQILEQSLLVLFYRDARSLDKVRIQYLINSELADILFSVPNCHRKQGWSLYFWFSLSEDYVVVCGRYTRLRRSNAINKTSCTSKQNIHKCAKR